VAKKRDLVDRIADRAACAKRQLADDYREGQDGKQNERGHVRPRGRFRANIQGRH
jgi:hypothetical protein